MNPADCITVVLEGEESKNITQILCVDDLSVSLVQRADYSNHIYEGVWKLDLPPRHQVYAKAL